MIEEYMNDCNKNIIHVDQLFWVRIQFYSDH